MQHLRSLLQQKTAIARYTNINANDTIEMLNSSQTQSKTFATDKGRFVKRTPLRSFEVLVLTVLLHLTSALINSQDTGSEFSPKA